MATACEKVGVDPNTKNMELNLQHLNFGPSSFYCFLPISCQSKANHGCHSFSKSDMLILLFVAQKPLSVSQVLQHCLFHKPPMAFFARS